MHTNRAHGSNHLTPSDPAVDAYIERFPPNVRDLLAEVRATIRAAAPTATEKMSYGIPTYATTENLVHFGGFKRHIGFFPTPSGIDAFADELEPFERSKGAVRFPLEEPMPVNLIRRIVAYRVAEARGRAGQGGR